MKQKEFDELLNRRQAHIESVLSGKAKEYASDNDRLHNFKRAGAMEGCTPEKALIGMFAKHMVSILDMVDDLEKGREHSMSQWNEKLGDGINYLILLEGLIVEREQMKGPQAKICPLQ